MPEPINLRLEFDPRDHQTLKLAAALAGHANLRSWCRSTLLDAARRTINDFRRPAKPAEGGEPCPGT